MASQQRSDRNSRATDFVGRRDALREVRAALTRRGCVILGEAGCGKTRLAREAVTAQRDATVLRVFATPTGSPLPFAPFADVLGDGLDTVPGALRRFRERHGDNPVLFIDDAHLLDDASAALVHALHTTGTARLVLTVREGMRVPDAVLACWSDHDLPRVDLQGLSPRQTTALITQILGGPPTGEFTRWVFDRTSGNPLYTIALLQDALDSGAATFDGSSWNHVPADLEYGTVQRVLARRLGTLTGDELHAMEILAIGAPLPLPVLETLVPGRALEGLERQALVTVSGTTPDFTVAIAHPLIAEAVLAGTPVTAGIRIRRRLAATMSAAEVAVERTGTRIAEWLLDAGERDDDLFGQAARTALRRGAPAMALRLAEAMEPGLRADVLRGSALLGLARFDEAEDVLALREEEARAEPRLQRTYLDTRARALVRSGRALPVVQQTLDRLARWRTDPTWAASIATHRAYIALHEGRVADALALVRPGSQDADLDLLSRASCVGFAAISQFELGRYDDLVGSVAFLRDLGALAPDPPWTLMHPLIALGIAAPALQGTDVDGAELTLADTESDATHRGDQAVRVIAQISRGELALHRGRIDEATDLLGRASDGLAAEDPADLRARTLITLAIACCWAGEPLEAATLLDRAEDITRGARTVTRYTPELTVARAFAEWAVTRRAAVASDLLQELSSMALTPRIEVEAYHLAAVMGSGSAALAAQLATRLTSLAETMQSPLAACHARHATAALDADPDRLLETAKDYAGLRRSIDAALAASAASAGFARRGSTGAAREASSFAHSQAASCTGAALLGTLLPTDLPRLTEREREIAALAAQGLANREIAARLVVSVRTVESTLLRACRKLGVTRRTDLDRFFLPG